MAETSLSCSTLIFVKVRTLVLGVKATETALQTYDCYWRRSETFVSSPNQNEYRTLPVRLSLTYCTSSHSRLRSAVGNDVGRSRVARYRTGASVVYGVGAEQQDLEAGVWRRRQTPPSVGASGGAGEARLRGGEGQGALRDAGLGPGVVSCYEAGRDGFWQHRTVSHCRHWAMSGTAITYQRTVLTRPRVRLATSPESTTMRQRNPESTQSDPTHQQHCTDGVLSL